MMVSVSQQEGGDAIAFAQYMDNSLTFEQAVLKLNDEHYSSVPNRDRKAILMNIKIMKLLSLLRHMIT